jgi:glycosyltransferase involved in cell wall biosynthesis
VAELKGKVPPFVVVIAGDGDARPRFEALAAELGVSDIVRFLGWRRDVAGILASLDLVVLPTTMDFEGVPVAVIEAQAVGRPIVATDVGGVAETVIPGKTGWLVPPRDAGRLAEAIADALSDRARAEAIGKAGQAHALSHFALKRYIDETESYLKQVAR